MSCDTAILGFGCAGYHAARALREAGYHRAIHVFSDSTLPPANPMLTTYYAGGKLPYEGLFPFGASLEDMARDLGLTLHCGSPVARLHGARRAVETADGEIHTFEQILIATGACPIVPPTQGIDPSRVYLMRTVADAERLKSRLAAGDVKSAVVVGASMVGIKVAELLLHAGVRPLLVDLAPRIFPLAALPEISTEIARRVEQAGIPLRFGAALEGLEEREGLLLGRLGDDTVKTDLVVFCIGTRPNLQFLDSAEIVVNRGVVVDECMRTSLPGIYAAGDCCAGDNLQSGEKQIIGLWASAGCQGRAAGYAMAGRAVPYEGTLLHNITHFLDMDFIGLGDAGAQGQVLDWQAPGGGLRLRAVLRDGRPACVNILDNHVISGPIKHYLQKCFAGAQDGFTPAQRGMLEGCGLPSAILNRLEGRA